MNTHKKPDSEKNQGKNLRHLFVHWVPRKEDFLTTWVLEFFAQFSSYKCHIELRYSIHPKDPGKDAGSPINGRDNGGLTDFLLVFDSAYDEKKTSIQFKTIIEDQRLAPESERLTLWIAPLWGVIHSKASIEEVPLNSRYLHILKKTGQRFEHPDPDRSGKWTADITDSAVNPILEHDKEKCKMCTQSTSDANSRWWLFSWIWRR